MSAERRVLASPELLRIIVEYSDNPTTAALVCKAWNVEAVGVIWNYIDNFQRLFELLGQTTCDKNGCLMLKRSIRPTDWERFYVYSSRIEELDNEDSCTDYATSLFSDIAATRPPQCLFPSLRLLTYTSPRMPARYLPMFLNNRLRSLAMRYCPLDPKDERDTVKDEDEEDAEERNDEDVNESQPDEEDPGRGTDEAGGIPAMKASVTPGPRFDLNHAGDDSSDDGECNGVDSEINSTLSDMALALSYLPSRTPLLEFFELSGDPDEGLSFDWTTFDDPCIAILSPNVLPHLKTLHLPLISKDLLLAIAGLPLLEELHLDVQSIASYMDRDLALPVGSFPSLEDLRITNTPGFIFLAIASVGLTKLVSVAANAAVDSGDDLEGLFKAFATHSPNLKLLSIRSPKQYRTSTQSGCAATLPSTVLAQLFPCRNLEMLKITSFSFKLTNEDIISLVQAFPHLTHLNVKNTVSSSTHSPNISVFLDMIPHCTELEELSISLDAKAEIPIVRSRATFPKLQSWDVGRSPATDHGMIAMYLSGILPTGGSLVFNRSSSYGEHWHKVNELLPMLLQVRQQERSMA
ncbi:hypothetical protein ONZ45_g3095 [Pleurotus djamor]|nr:hypothetical protein ONZ45_g3095 [Pleurotus djamor]